MTRSCTNVVFCTVVMVACLVVIQPPATAGLSAENVVVIVNADSHESRTVANHYVQQRAIPSANVIFLEDIPAGLKITLQDFKSKILRPIFAHLDKRRAAGHVRVVAYSAGFPTSVDISEHTRRLTDPDQKKYQKPTASITGLTYFYQFVLGDSERYLDWGSNLYARGPFSRSFLNPFLDEARRQEFDDADEDFKAERFEKAAGQFAMLFQSHPTIASLALRVAESKSRLGDSAGAKEWIVKAVDSGWDSGTYLEQHDAFKSLMESDDMRLVRSRLSEMPIEQQSPVSFAANIGWAANGSQVPTQNGIPYMMSCLLAVVHDRGSTIDQAIEVIQRAGDSDFQQPAGEFWFTSTKDVRTKARLPGFGDARLWLQTLGHRVELLHTNLPEREGTCAGLMLGTPIMKLEDRAWEFAPGAIAENLTSHSGNFGTAAQSKITNLLHAGAAMTSGPVHEPYSIPFKFPTAMIHGYYASGVTAMEAFCLSVQSPYQLLIVGDPLAQPFAGPPNDLVIAGLRADNPRQIQIQRRAVPSLDGRAETSSMELFIEGSLVQTVASLNNVRINLPQELSGAFELRTVLVGGGPMQPRRSHIDWIELRGESELPKVSWNADAKQVKLECPGATSIELVHHTNAVGKIEGDKGTILIDRTLLGDGPLRVRPVARHGERSVPGRMLIITD